MELKDVKLVHITVENDKGEHFDAHCKWKDWPLVEKLLKKKYRGVEGKEATICMVSPDSSEQAMQVAEEL